MSVSLREVIEAGGYDLTNIDDIKWLRSKAEEIEELMIEAEDAIEKANDLAEINSLKEELSDTTLDQEDRDLLEEELKSKIGLYISFYEEEV